MPLQDYVRVQVNWFDLAIWRRVVLLACLAAFSYLGPMDGYLDLKIYKFDPEVPVPSSGQIYPVHVMHGHLRYVTQAELEQMRYWRDRAQLVGIPFVVAFLLLATAGDARRKFASHVRTASIGDHQ